jgi:hypothetical protein
MTTEANPNRTLRFIATVATVAVMATSLTMARATSAAAETGTPSLPAPAGLTATSGRDRQVPLTWQPPEATGGPPITSYIVQFRPVIDPAPDPESNWLPFTCATPPVGSGEPPTACTVTGLANGTEHQFRVATTATYDGSPLQSGWSTITATPATTPQAPDAPTVSRGDGFITVTWQQPGDTGGLPITSYVVEYRPGNLPNSEWFTATCATPADTTCIVTGLAKGTAYVFRVAASNAIGSSAPSEQSEAIVFATVPGKPGPLSAGVGANQNIGWIAFPSRISGFWVQFTANLTSGVDDGGLPITGFEFRLFNVATQEFVPSDEFVCLRGEITAPPRCEVSNKAIGGSTLFPGRYGVSMVLINAIGASAASGAIDREVFLAPGTPRNVSAKRGDGQVELSWDEPESDGGKAITGYTVTASPGGRTCSTTGSNGSPPLTNCIVTGLRNGSEYTFSIRASNGDFSPADSIRATPAGLPWSPTITDASTLNNRSASISWIPRADGGSPITGYTVTASPGDRTCSTTSSNGSPPSTTCTIPGLDYFTSYSFSVSATTSVGNSVASEEVSLQPKPPIPFPRVVALSRGVITVEISQFDGGTPSSLIATAKSGEFQATCRVTPVDDQNRPMTKVGTCQLVDLPDNRSFTLTAEAHYGSNGSGTSTPSLAVTPSNRSTREEDLFPDVTDLRVEELTRSVSMLALRGIALGTGPKTFSPTLTVTRQQMALFMWRMKGSPNGPSECGFTDQKDIASNARVATCWLQANGITTNNPYNPTGTVTRDQMAAFLWRLAGKPDGPDNCGFIETKERIQDWARKGACWLKANEITKNNPYNPAGTVTRDQMARFLYRLGGTFKLWVAIPDDQLQ